MIFPEKKTCLMSRGFRLPSGNQTWPRFIDDFPWRPPFLEDYQRVFDSPPLDIAPFARTGTMLWGNRWLLRPSELGRYHPKLVIGKAMVWGSHISGSPHIIGQHHFRWFPCASNCVSLWCLSGLVEHPTGPGVGFHGDLRQLWSEAAKTWCWSATQQRQFYGFCGATAWFTCCTCQMAMDQYLLIPFVGGWTSIYQLFWCSPGVQGFDTLPNWSWSQWNFRWGHISLYDLDPQAVQVGTPAHACAQCAVAVAGDGWNSGALGLPGLPIGPRLRGLDEFCRFAIAKTEGNIGKLISFYPLLLVVFFLFALEIRANFMKSTSPQFFVGETAMCRPCRIWVSQIHEEAYGDIMTAWHQALDPRKRGKIEDGRAKYLDVQPSYSQFSWDIVD